MYIFIFAYIYVCTYICIYMYTMPAKCRPPTTYLYMYIYIYIYTHLHTYMYIRIYVYTCIPCPPTAVLAMERCAVASGPSPSGLGEGGFEGRLSSNSLLLPFRVAVRVPLRVEKLMHPAALPHSTERAAALARVACPHKSTSRVGVNLKISSQLLRLIFTKLPQDS